MKKTLILENKLEQIAKLEGFVEDVCQDVEAPPTLSFELNLALEEAVANVINYAYPKDELHTLQLTAEQLGDQLVFEIIDSGKPFNPLTDAKEPDVTLSAEERPIGGLGIFLMRQLMHHLAYKRENGFNILTLSKKLN